MTEIKGCQKCGATVFVYSCPGLMDTIKHCSNPKCDYSTCPTCAELKERIEELEGSLEKMISILIETREPCPPKGDIVTNCDDITCFKCWLDFLESTKGGDEDEDNG